MKVQLEKNDIYLCPDCGLPYVSRPVWINVTRSGITVEYQEGEETFCNHCKEHKAEDLIHASRVEDLDDHLRFEAAVGLAAIECFITGDQQKQES